MKEIVPGLRFTVEATVGESDTAQALGSGTLPVLATPRMAALMEEAAWRSVAPYLEAGESSVGVSLTLQHVSATPVGLRVRVESELTAAGGRKLRFTVKAFDEAGPIGEAEHERVVIAERRFMDKAEGKRKEF